MKTLDVLKKLQMKKMREFLNLAIKFGIDSVQAHDSTDECNAITAAIIYLEASNWEKKRLFKLINKVSNQVR